MEARWREFWLSLSVVNLLFFRRWAEVLPGGHDYFLEAARSPQAYLSLMFLVLFITLGVWAVGASLRRTGRPWALWGLRGGFILLLGVGLWGVGVEAWVFLGRPEVPSWVGLVALVIPLLVVGWLLWRHAHRLRRVVPAAVMVALLVSPLAPILFAQGLYHGLTPATATARFSPPLAGMMGADEGERRMVIVVFDELDERLVFERRPPDLALPEIDRLRNESLHATHAYAPNAATLRSIPSMTTGRFVAFAQPHSIDGNLLRFRGEDERVEWRETETLFHTAREAGHDVGVVGTYHPYCRIFEGVLSRCVFESHYQPQTGGWMALLVEHLEQWSQKLPTDDLTRDFSRTVGRSEAVTEALQEREIHKAQVLTEAAVEMVADRGLELVFVHVNMPHPTGPRDYGVGYYDPVNGTYGTGLGFDYFDNLALTDRVLGQMRRAMEAAGVWNETTLLVTSDHGYRSQIWHADPRDDPEAPPLQAKTDHRTVFLLKMADGSNASRFEEPFNLVLLPRLTDAVLAGDVRTGPEAERWLAEHRTVGPAPYYKVR